MSNDSLPRYVPAGKTRYKATLRDPAQNPFVSRPSVVTQTVDVDSSTPLAQVEQWAREAASEKKFIFMSIEKVL